MTGVAISGDRLGVAIVGLVIGLVFCYGGLALLTNRHGFGDWLEEADRRRRDLTNGGTVWRPWDREPSATGPGVVLLILGAAIIVAAIGSV